MQASVDRRGIAVAYLPGLAVRRIADLYPGATKTGPLTELQDVASGQRGCVAPSSAPPRRLEHSKHQVCGRDLWLGPTESGHSALNRSPSFLLVAALRQQLQSALSVSHSPRPETTPKPSTST